MSSSYLPLIFTQHVETFLVDPQAPLLYTFLSKRGNFYLSEIRFSERNGIMFGTRKNMLQGPKVKHSWLIAIGLKDSGLPPAL